VSLAVALAVAAPLAVAAVPAIAASPTPSIEPGPSEPAPCSSPLQAVVDDAKAGSTVRLPACTSTEGLQIDRPLRVEAAGAVIDGRGTLEYAVQVKASDVSITGLTVRDVASPQQDGAVHAWDVDRFTFTDGLVTGAAGGCISVARSHGSVLEDSTFIACGQEGVHGSQADGLVIRGNRMIGNNPKLAVDPGWEAGGAKVSRSTGVVFEQNEVSDNGGPGIWCDIDCRDLTVRDNRVSGNDRAGIQVEISDGATVTGNTVWENGWGHAAWGWGAGILVSSSRSVDVTHNLLAWNADGIVVVTQDRDDSPGPTTDVHTSDNVVASEGGYEAFGVAWLQDWAGGITDAASGNGGAGDRFWYSGAEDGDARYAWGDELSGLTAFAATPGGQGDAYLTDEEVRSQLEAEGVPAQPVPGRPLGPTGIRSFILPAVVAGSALLFVVVAAVTALILVRRRRSAAVAIHPVTPGSGPPEPPAQE
jgi:parallel beta-helix repeat protein